MKLQLERIVLFSFAYCFVLHDNWYVTGLSSSSSSKSSKKDYYELLEVRKDASDREIKKAFHRMATKFHPDKNKKPGAEEKFREIALAYEVLSCPDKRKKYDRFGHAAFEGGAAGGGGSGGSFNFGSFEDLFRHFGEPFDHDGNSFHFSFGGNDFDDFWPDNDEGDPFSSFGFGEQFGGGDSFFGTHFGQGNGHSHEAEEHRGYKESRTHSSGRSCRTVTQRVGNMVTTYTQCS